MSPDTVLGRASQLLLGATLLCFLFGSDLGIAGANALSILLLGGAMLTAAVYIFRTGDTTLLRLRKKTERDAEATPNTWAVLLLCVGASLVLLYVALWLGLDKRVFSAAQRFAATAIGTSVVWLLIGVGIVVWGVINFRTPAPQNNPLEKLKEAPHQLAGVVLVLIGLVVVGVNVLKLFAPDTLDSLTNEFLSWLAL